jgi:hypothetical protein
MPTRIDRASIEATHVISGGNTTAVDFGPPIY